MVGCCLTTDPDSNNLLKIKGEECPEPYEECRVQFPFSRMKQTNAFSLDYFLDRPILLLSSACAVSLICVSPTLPLLFGGICTLILSATYALQWFCKAEFFPGVVVVTGGLLAFW